MEVEGIGEGAPATRAMSEAEVGAGAGAGGGERCNIFLDMVVWKYHRACETGLEDGAAEVSTRNLAFGVPCCQRGIHVFLGRKDSTVRRPSVQQLQSCHTTTVASDHLLEHAMGLEDKVT